MTGKKRLADELKTNVVTDTSGNLLNKSVGELIDYGLDVTDKIKELKKQITSLEGTQKDLINLLKIKLASSLLTSASGNRARIVEVENSFFTLQDYTLFTKYVHKTKRYELLQKRLSQGNINLVQEELGVTVPGVGVMTTKVYKFKPLLKK